MGRLALVCLLVAVAVAGCGGDAPAPAQPQSAAPRHATVRVGDTTVRANAIRTTALDAAVAGRYGIERRPGTVLLLVAAQRGEAGDPVRVGVRASVTDLRGQRRPVEMRELHGFDPAGAPLLDHFGLVEVSPPDTLRFDLEVALPGSAPVVLRLEQDVRPD